MSALERHGSLAPFPRLPAGVNGLSLRPFGLFRSDLEIDFDQYSRPHLVTQILQCCTTSEYGELPDPDFLWDLTSGKRIECLAMIATSKDSSGLAVHLRCANETCLQEMELEITLHELASIQHPVDGADHFSIQVGDESLPIRKPTGRDQCNWLELSFSDEDTAIRAMIQTLLVESSFWGRSSIPDEWVRSIDRAMEEHDPLVNFVLMIPCPHCDLENRHDIDLQELTLDVLRREQLRLLEAVHRLALHYHWGEEQMFSLPPWRFRHYLALIEEEENR